ncbi:MAG TPA: PQQ-binding-like beta-propeller repeat protein [Pirellulales bacterium]|nr:PQQ-binding-like beta-propeller repeat protein [Pirellulales bacterium]
MSRLSVVRRCLAVVALLSGTILPGLAGAEEWPCWRGPRGDGTSAEQNIPTTWDGTRGDNIAWKTEIPGTGHASPVVWDDRIFVASCLENESDRLLICLDRRSGEIVWQRSVMKSPLEKKHQLNSYASSTPATDGKLIYVSFLEGTQAGEAKGARMAVAAYDLDGQRRWLVYPGVFSSVHGYCSCPVLFEDKVIINGDHDGDAYLVALDRDSGETLWKVPRENKTRSYCTPIIREIDGRWQMILSGSKCVASYDPHDGSRHWLINGPTEQFVASMVYDGKLLFLSAGFPDHHILAIRPDGKGDVSKTHIAWRTTENCSYVPSPVVVDDYFLIVSDEGIGSCYDAASGKRLWKHRMGPHYSASLVTAGGLVYFLSDEGVTTVVKPGEQYHEVAKAPLGEACYASPALSHGQIYLRGVNHLFAVGGKQVAQR